MESIIRLKMQKDGMKKESKSQDGGFSLCIASQEQELRLSGQRTGRIEAGPFSENGGQWELNVVVEPRCCWFDREAPRKVRQRVDVGIKRA